MKPGSSENAVCPLASTIHNKLFATNALAETGDSTTATVSRARLMIPTPRTGQFSLAEAARKIPQSYKDSFYLAQGEAVSAYPPEQKKTLLDDLYNTSGTQRYLEYIIRQYVQSNTCFSIICVDLNNFNHVITISSGEHESGYLGFPHYVPHMGTSSDLSIKLDLVRNPTDIGSIKVQRLGNGTLFINGIRLGEPERSCALALVIMIYNGLLVGINGFYVVNIEYGARIAESWFGAFCGGSAEEVAAAMLVIGFQPLINPLGPLRAEQIFLPSSLWLACWLWISQIAVLALLAVAWFGVRRRMRS